ncbi:MAG: DUF2933 domain-containing protein [Notoacmeibacter sp.]|nr:DUF2933 domain-containing protein [Notoacmeibacter sp.]
MGTPAVILAITYRNTLIVARVGVGLLLGYGHRARILGSDWFLWLSLLIGFGMHFFMHGAHVGHGGLGWSGDKS